jgi:flagellar basal body-associated protein FliL
LSRAGTLALFHRYSLKEIAMRSKSSIVSMIVVSALILVIGAMAAGFAAGVNGAEDHAGRHNEPPGDSGSMVA